MSSRGSIATDPAYETAIAFAKTLAPNATALTYRPDEVRTRPAVATELPSAALSVSLGATVEDTSVIYERVMRGRRAEAEPDKALSQSPAESYEIVAPIGRGG